MRAAGVRAATPQTAASLYYKFIEKDVKIGYTPYTGYGGITDFCITGKMRGVRMIVKEQPVKVKMAIGIDNFREMREKQNYYVDKTRLIAEYLTAGDKVTLLTRPRRFGKTLNMSMLAEFFDITKDSADIFAGTEIMETKWAEKMNQYPVIALSFANARGENAKFLLNQLSGEVRKEYMRYEFLWREKKLPDNMCRELQRIYECMWSWEKKEGFNYLSFSLSGLCTALQCYYGKGVKVFIDEYDTPIIQALISGFYQEIKPVFSVMLGSLLKGNASLESAYLTGIQRVAKENIFSGLNNLAVCTVNSPEYADCFGFTEQETRELLEACGLQLDEKVKEMYDGYRFGNFHIYNPWSITNYARRKRREPFWVNTSENSLIRSAMRETEAQFRPGYEALIENGTYRTEVKMDSSFYEVHDAETLWGMLLCAGMLTAEEVSADGMCTLRVPNREVMRAFRELTALYAGTTEGSMSQMFRWLAEKDLENFSREYKRLLRTLPSYYDLKEENSYHMMMLGMCTFMISDYNVESNRESGLGRSDIILRAKTEEKPNIIMEFKYTKDENKELRELAREGLEQIGQKDYAAGLRGEVVCIGLGHRGKEAELEWKVNTLSDK